MKEKTEKHIKEIKEKLKDESFDIMYRYLWVDQIKRLEKDIKYYEKGLICY